MKLILIEPSEYIGEQATIYDINGNRLGQIEMNEELFNSLK